MLNLLDITSKFWIVAMFVIADPNIISYAMCRYTFDLFPY